MTTAVSDQDMAALSPDNARLYFNLGKAQTHLAIAQRLTATGSFAWKPASGHIVWSDEMHRIFELDRGTKPTVQFILSRVHADDRDRLRQLINDATRAAQDLDVEYRTVMPDGAVKHVHLVAHAMLDEATGATEYLGAVIDVTAVKASRQALESAYAEIRALKDRLQSENIVLREEIDKTSMFEEIVGTSPPLRVVLSHVSKVAPTDSTVLITGETGTGKELVARAIHKRSPRAARAFVAVNCAAIPPSLIASELFGHEKGAFTGALQRRQGRFELADDGTIFLDEVGELPAETQIMLLRVLQEREFERVGGSGTHPRERPGDRRNEPGSACRHRRRDLPRGPLLSAQRVPIGRAPPARPSVRYSPARRVLHPSLRQARRQGGSAASPRRRRRSFSRTTGRATSASCRTSSSAR